MKQSMFKSLISVMFLVAGIIVLHGVPFFASKT